MSRIAFTWDKHVSEISQAQIFSIKKEPRVRWIKANFSADHGKKAEPQAREIKASVRKGSCGRKIVL